MEESAYPRCIILRSMAQQNPVPLRKVRHVVTLFQAFKRNVSTNVGVRRLEAQQPVENGSKGPIGGEQLLD